MKSAKPTPRRPQGRFSPAAARLSSDQSLLNRMSEYLEFWERPQRKTASKPRRKVTP